MSGKTETEATDIEERQSPGGHIVYEAVLKEGEEELERSNSALAWSGLAAGLSMGFSLVGHGLLKHHLPKAEWATIVATIGYSLGFLIVVLGRQQLFTENTLTVVLPLLRHKKSKVFSDVARLWTIVFLANLAGAFLFALALTKTAALDASTIETFREIAREATAQAFAVVFVRGIFAGWLIALMVWLLPFAETARLGVIVILTWTIALAKFAHVVAGAVEAFLVALTGDITWGHALGGFLIPALLGNIVGGVTLVAALNHAQVVSGEEEDEEAEEEHLIVTPEDGP